MAKGAVHSWWTWNEYFQSTRGGPGMNIFSPLVVDLDKIFAFGVDLILTQVSVHKNMLIQNVLDLVDMFVDESMMQETMPVVKPGRAVV